MNWNIYHTKPIKQKYVYRYLTLEKLIDFLETGDLFLSRLDKFEDNLENISPYDINELRMSNGLTVKPKNANANIPEHTWAELIENNRAGLVQIQKRLHLEQKHRFVSCWILNDVESFAMWDIYGKSGFVIRFESDYFEELIKTSIKNQKGNTSQIDLLVAGSVEYQNFDDMVSKEKESRLRFSVFRKHLSFHHENEYRIVGFMNEIIETSGLRYKLPDLETLKFDIFANPRLDSFQFEKYQGILEKYSENHPLTESELKIWLEFRNNKYE